MLVRRSLGTSFMGEGSPGDTTNKGCALFPMVWIWAMEQFLGILGSATFVRYPVPTRVPLPRPRRSYLTTCVLCSRGSRILDCRYRYSHHIRHYTWAAIWHMYTYRNTKRNQLGSRVNVHEGSALVPSGGCPTLSTGITCSCWPYCSTAQAGEVCFSVMLYIHVASSSGKTR